MEAGSQGKKASPFLNKIISSGTLQAQRRHFQRSPPMTLPWEDARGWAVAQWGGREERGGPGCRVGARVPAPALKAGKGRPNKGGLMPGPCEHTIQMPGAGALECTGKLTGGKPASKQEGIINGREAGRARLRQTPTGYGRAELEPHPLGWRQWVLPTGRRWSNCS